MTDNYTLPLSKAKANTLYSGNGLALQRLPDMGYERLMMVVPSKKDPVFKDRLYLQNISGSFQLYCFSQPVSNWKEVFKDFNFCGVI